MQDIIKTTFKLRRGDISVWQKNNPILEKGEPSVAYKDNKIYCFKIGDGATNWNDLQPFLPGNNGSTSNQSSVISVNGQTGNVQLSAMDVGAEKAYVNITQQYENYIPPTQEEDPFIEPYNKSPVNYFLFQIKEQGKFFIEEQDGKRHYCEALKNDTNLYLKIYSFGFFNNFEKDLTGALVFPFVKTMEYFNGKKINEIELNELTVLEDSGETLTLVPSTFYNTPLIVEKPIFNKQVANKQYVDDEISNALASIGIAENLSF